MTEHHIGIQRLDRRLDVEVGGSVVAWSIMHRLLRPRSAIHQGLPTAPRRIREAEASPPDLPTHVRTEVEDYLRAVPLHHATPKTLAQQQHLYDCLTIIDGKAQALLSFNSFMLAIVGVYVGTVEAIRDLPIIMVPFAITTLASGISCLLCVDVVWVHWLPKRDMTPKPENDNKDIGEGFVELVRLRDERTRTYRIAWFLSFLSVITILLGVISAVLAGLVI